MRAYIIMCVCMCVCMYVFMYETMSVHVCITDMLLKFKVASIYGQTCIHIRRRPWGSPGARDASPQNLETLMPPMHLSLFTTFSSFPPQIWVSPILLTSLSQCISLNT